MNSRLKFFKIFLVIFIPLFFVSCDGGSYTTTKSKEKTTTTSTEMNYSTFKGKKYKTIRLKASDKLKLEIEVKTIEGSLKIALTDDENNELFSVINPNEHITENLSIPKDGTYYIEVSGDHSGSYEINWDIVK